ncbi:hypothetical protein C799_01200 [Bacteroides thetaiotaomicron dnLKV9]|uniref:Uncharacterized protein n=1 Tax=Bacteroides thetaiotaomicron dnLKV9 TaxID=1235785 RepID=R9HDU2_BACT4|nr:hypothetical protein C799_01200 [Bacteroides thetaiotaomicron dnLKV9]
MTEVLTNSYFVSISMSLDKWHWGGLFSIFKDDYTKYEQS